MKEVREGGEVIPHNNFEKNLRQNWRLIFCGLFGYLIKGL